MLWLLWLVQERTGILSRSPGTLPKLSRVSWKRLLKKKATAHSPTPFHSRSCCVFVSLFPSCWAPFWTPLLFIHCHRKNEELTRSAIDSLLTTWGRGMGACMHSLLCCLLFPVEWLVVAVLWLRCRGNSWINSCGCCSLLLWRHRSSCSVFVCCVPLVGYSTPTFFQCTICAAYHSSTHSIHSLTPFTLHYTHFGFTTFNKQQIKDFKGQKSWSPAPQLVKDAVK